MNKAQRGAGISFGADENGQHLIAWEMLRKPYCPHCSLPPITSTLPLAVCVLYSKGGLVFIFSGTGGKRFCFSAQAMEPATARQPDSSSRPLSLA